MDSNHDTAVEALLETCNQPELQSDNNQTIITLINNPKAECWSQNANTYPPFKDIVEALQDEVQTVK